MKNHFDSNQITTLLQRFSCTIFIVLTVACVPQSDYEDIKDKYDVVNSKYTDLEKKVKELESTLYDCKYAATHLLEEAEYQYSEKQFNNAKHTLLTLIEKHPEYKIQDAYARLYEKVEKSVIKLEEEEERERIEEELRKMAGGVVVWVDRPDWKSIPLDFNGTEPNDLKQVLDRLVPNRKKTSFETDNEFIERIESLVASSEAGQNIIGNEIVFAEDMSCRYILKSEKFTCDVGVHDITGTFGSPYKSITALLLSEYLTLSSTSQGETVYGVRRKVEKRYLDRYYIMPRNPRALGQLDNISIPIERHEAKDVDGFHIIYIGSLVPPYLKALKYTIHEASIDNPVERNLNWIGIKLDIREAWVYREDNGELVKRITFK